jgi:aminoglycoside phosphotransferase (APT) family kinase protein
MEFVEGRIFRDLQLSALSKGDRAAVYDSMNDALAKLHNVTIGTVGLEDFGKPANYFERQMGAGRSNTAAPRTEHRRGHGDVIAWCRSRAARREHRDRAR